MDDALPFVDGEGVARAPRERRNGDIPIVLVTAVTAAEAMAVRIGACEVLRKPFEIDELLRAVREHIA